MKIIYASIIGLCIIQSATAQKTELSFGLSGNITAFRGAGAAKTTSIYISDVSGLPNYSGAAFGKNAGLGWGAEVSLQRVTKSKLIMGVSTAYEILSSKADITQVGARVMVPADGSVRYSYEFANLYPYIGKRMIDTKQKVDVNIGLDVALPLSAHEKGKATTATVDGTINTDVDRNKPKMDLRPKVQIGWQYNHIGIQGSFAVGVLNAYRSMVGGDFKAYANVARLGVFYRL